MRSVTQVAAAFGKLAAGRGFKANQLLDRNLALLGK